MTIRKYALWLGLVPLALGATFFTACGGGDDDDDGGNDSSSNSSKNDNDDKDTKSDDKGDTKASSADEKFVSDLCKIGATFARDLDKAEPPANADDLGNLTKPFEKFAEDFDDLKPPKDLKDWHDQASKALNDLVKALKDGDFEAMAEADQPFPELPDAARERFEKLAEKDKDCQEAENLFGE